MTHPRGEILSKRLKNTYREVIKARRSPHLPIKGLSDRLQRNVTHHRSGGETFPGAFSTVVPHCWGSGPRSPFLRPPAPSEPATKKCT